VYNAYLESFYINNPVARAAEILSPDQPERKSARNLLSPIQLGIIKEEHPPTASVASSSTQSSGSSSQNNINGLREAPSSPAPKSQLPPLYPGTGSSTSSTAGVPLRVAFRDAEVSRLNVFGPRRDRAAFEFARRKLGPHQHVSHPSSATLTQTGLSEESGQRYKQQLLPIQSEHPQTDGTHEEGGRNAGQLSSNASTAGGVVAASQTPSSQSEHARIHDNPLTSSTSIPSSTGLVSMDQSGASSAAPSTNKSSPQLPFDKQDVPNEELRLSIDGPSVPRQTQRRSAQPSDLKSTAAQIDLNSLTPEARQLFSLESLLAISSACYYNDINYLRSLESYVIGYKTVEDESEPAPVRLRDDLTLFSAVLSRADFDKRTPLHVAALAGQADAVRFLLSHGASIHAIDRMGRTPLDAAITSGNLTIASEIRAAGGWSATELTSLDVEDYNPLRPAAQRERRPSLHHPSTPLFVPQPSRSGGPRQQSGTSIPTVRSIGGMMFSLDANPDNQTDDEAGYGGLRKSQFSDPGSPDFEDNFSSEAAESNELERYNSLQPSRSPLMYQHHRQDSPAAEDSDRGAEGMQLIRNNSFGPSPGFSDPRAFKSTASVSSLQRIIRSRLHTPTRQHSNLDLREGEQSGEDLISFRTRTQSFHLSDPSQAASPGPPHILAAPGPAQAETEPFQYLATTTTSIRAIDGNAVPEKPHVPQQLQHDSLPAFASIRGDLTQRDEFDDDDAVSSTEPSVHESESEHTLAFLMCGAATQGDLQLLADLLFHGANPNAADLSGRTPLHLAAARSQPSAARFLLEALADPSAVDSFGRTPLDEALRANCAEIVAMISYALAQRDQGSESVSTTGSGSDVPRHVPLSQPIKTTPSRRPSRAEVGSATLAAASLKLVGALVEACRSGDIPKVKQLLEQGSRLNPPVDIETTDYDGRTLLFHAVESGSEDMVKTLLELGVDPTARDNTQLTAFYFAKLLRYSRLASLIAEGARDWDKRRALTLVSQPKAAPESAPHPQEAAAREEALSQSTHQATTAGDVYDSVRPSPSTVPSSQLPLVAYSAQFDWPSGDRRLEQELLAPEWRSQATGALRYRPITVSTHFIRSYLNSQEEPALESGVAAGQIVDRDQLSPTLHDALANPFRIFEAAYHQPTNHIYIGDHDELDQQSETSMTISPDHDHSATRTEAQQMSFDPSLCSTWMIIRKLYTPSKALTLWPSLVGANGRQLPIPHPAAFGATPTLDWSLYYAQHPWLLPDVEIPAPLMFYHQGQIRGWKLMVGKFRSGVSNRKWMPESPESVWDAERINLLQGPFGLYSPDATPMSSLVDGNTDGFIVSPLTPNSLECPDLLSKPVPKPVALSSLKGFPTKPWPFPPPRYTAIVTLETQTVEVKFDLNYGASSPATSTGLTPSGAGQLPSPTAATIISPSSSCSSSLAPAESPDETEVIRDRFIRAPCLCIKPVSPYSDQLMCRPRAHARLGLLLPAFRRALSALLPRLAARFKFAHVEWLMPGVTNTALEVFTDIAAVSVEPKLPSPQSLVNRRVNRHYAKIFQIASNVADQALLLYHAASQAYHRASCFMDIPIIQQDSNRDVSVEAAAFRSHLPISYLFGSDRPSEFSPRGDDVSNLTFSREDLARRCGFSGVSAFPVFGEDGIPLGVVCGYYRALGSPVETSVTKIPPVQTVCLATQREIVETLARFSKVLWRLFRLGGTLSNATRSDKPLDSTHSTPTEYDVLDYAKDLEEEFARALSIQNNETGGALHRGLLTGKGCSPISESNKSQDAMEDAAGSSQAISTKTHCSCRDCFINATNCAIGRSDPMWFLGVLMSMGVLDPFHSWLMDLDSEMHRAAARVLPFLLSLEPSLRRIEDDLWLRCQAYLIHRTKFLYTVSPHLVAMNVNLLDVRKKLQPTIHALVREGLWFTETELVKPATEDSLTLSEDEEEQTKAESTTSTQQDRRFATLWVFDSSSTQSKSGSASSSKNTKRASAISEVLEKYATIIEALRLSAKRERVAQPRPWYGCPTCALALYSMCHEEINRRTKLSDDDFAAMHRSLEEAGCVSNSFCMLHQFSQKVSASDRGNASDVYSALQEATPGVIEELLTILRAFGPRRPPSPALLSIRMRLELGSAIQAYNNAPDNLHSLVKRAYKKPSILVPPRLSGWDLYDVLGPQGTGGVECACDEAEVTSLAAEMLTNPSFQLSPKYIRKLHGALTLTDDVVKGQYRTHVTVGSFQFYRFYRCFVPPEEIEEALHCLCATFNDPKVRELPAPIRAHYLYATFIYVIHPFEDGNGRIGRLLANLVLKQAGFPWAIDHLAKILTVEGLLHLIVKKSS